MPVSLGGAAPAKKLLAPGDPPATRGTDGRTDGRRRLSVAVNASGSGGNERQSPLKVAAGDVLRARRLQPQSFNLFLSSMSGLRNALFRTDAGTCRRGLIGIISLIKYGPISPHKETCVALT